MIFPDNLTKKELQNGFIYLAVSLILLPSLIALLPLRDGQLNFLYYCFNFLAVILIFRRYLWQSVRTALDSLFPTLYYAALGYLGYQALGQILSAVILANFPDFSNVNDQGIFAMLEQDLYLMTIGTVLLVPLAEECFYRGLIFRGLYDRSPVLAYIVSMAAFALIHVAGYIGSCDAVQLLLCFIQYLPAGYCLCFAYRHSGTILSPILIHTIVNALSIYAAVR